MKETQPTCTRVVLIGPTNVGKTSLVDRLMYYRFKSDNECTLGATYTSHYFITEEVNGEQKRVKMDIWDTAGGPRYNSLIPAFVKNDSLVVVCIDRDDDELVKKYIDTLTFSQRGCKFFVCITKQDQLDRNKREPIMGFNKIKFLVLERFDPTDQMVGVISGIYYTSSLTGIGIQEMFTDLAYHLKPHDEEILCLDKTSSSNKTGERMCSGCKIPSSQFGWR